VFDGGTSLHAQRIRFRQGIQIVPQRNISARAEDTARRTSSITSATEHLCGCRGYAFFEGLGNVIGSPGISLRGQRIPAVRLPAMTQAGATLVPSDLMKLPQGTSLRRQRIWLKSSEVSAGRRNISAHVEDTSLARTPR
jgi:hypothetical protein